MVMSEAVSGQQTKTLVSSRFMKLKNRNHWSGEIMIRERSEEDSRVSAP